MYGVQQFGRTEGPSDIHFVLAGLGVVRVRDMYDSDAVLTCLVREAQAGQRPSLRSDKEHISDSSCDLFFGFCRGRGDDALVPTALKRGTSLRDHVRVVAK